MNLTAASITIHVLCGVLLAFLAICEIAKIYNANSKIKKFEPLAFFLVAVLSTIAIVFYGRPNFIERLKNRSPLIHLMAPILILYCLAMSSFISEKINKEWEKIKHYFILIFFLSLLAISYKMSGEERHGQIISHLFISLPGIIYSMFYILPFSKTENRGKIKAILLFMSAFQLFFYKEASNSFGEHPTLSFSEEFTVNINEKDTDKKWSSDKPISGT